MSDLKLAVPGNDYLPELRTTQVQVALGASGAFSVTNNIATITFTSAHGLTFSPAAGILPNYFITFNGVSGISGTGTLNGPVFQILAIPSTTTIQIWTTVTAATMTAANAWPVFFPQFQSALLSGAAQWYWNNALTSTITPTFPQFGSVQLANMNLGGNAAPYYNPDNTNVIQTAGPVATTTTLSTAPTMRVISATATSTGGLAGVRFGPQDYIICNNGTAGTTYLSLVE